MNSPRILIGGLLIAVSVGCWFVFRVESPSDDSVLKKSDDRSAELAMAPGASEPQPRTRAGVPAPLHPAPPAEATAQTSDSTSTARLHLVDDASGAELDHIALYRGNPFERAGTILPTKGQLSDCIGTNLASPVAIKIDENQARNGPTTYFASNHDHAWGQISLEPTSPHEFALRLKPGGDLRVTIAGAEQYSAAKLNLWRMDVSPPSLLANWPLSELEPGLLPSLNLDHLPTGTYRAGVIQGTDFQQQELASQFIEIRAGESSEVTLTIGEEVPQRVELRLKLLFHPGWALESFELEVEAADAPSGTARSQRIQSSEMVRESAGTFACQSCTVDSGLYRFTIADASFAVQAMIGPRPVQELEIVVPAPGLVVVDVMDEATGETVSDAKLQWFVEELDALANLPGGHFVAERSPGRFEFRAPVGLIGICARSGMIRGYPSRLQSVDVVSGTNAVTIKLERGYSVVLTLAEDGKRVPWQKSWVDEASLAGVGDDQVFAPGEFDAGLGLYTFRVSGPGSYQLKLRKMPGYREVSFNSTLYDTPTRRWSIALPLVRD